VVQRLTRLDRDPFAGPGHNAIHSGIRTRSVTLVVAACQPHDQLGEHVDDEGDVDEPAQVLQ
jgi:hypothetical protein